MVLARLSLAPGRARRTRRLALDPASIRRITVSLIASELERFSQCSVSPETWLGWGDDLGLDERGIGFDSLALLDLCTATNEFFHLFESGVEDYLFVRRTLGEWVTVIARGLELRADHLGFRTSGSTGRPKLCVHSMRGLNTELQTLGEILPEATRVVSLVPPHHIYGFLFSVGLPLHLDIPVIDARGIAPGALARQLTAGDVVIATPFLWNVLLRNIRQWPEGVTGVSSTAAMPMDLTETLKAAGLSRLLEIYGSTETAGIGWRDDHTGPFRLFPHWRFSTDERRLWRDLGDGSPEEIPIMDRLERLGEDGGFRPAGRLDQAVQIGGTNVYPARIAAVIEAMPGVSRCLIRLDGNAENEAAIRLKAFVVPDKGQTIDDLEQRIRQELAQWVSAVERPVRYSFGTELPVNAIGKDADW